MPRGSDYTNPTDAPGILLCWGKSKYGQTSAVLPFGRPSDKCDSAQFCWDLDDGWRNVSAGMTDSDQSYQNLI